MIRRPSVAELAAWLVSILALVVIAGLPASSVLAGEPAAPEPPSAFDLLERVRARYGGLEVYADSGVLEVRRGPGEGEPAGRFRLATGKDADGSFRLELVEAGADEATEGAVEAADPGAEPRRLLLWRDADGGTFLYDGARGETGEYRPVDSPLAALAQLPGGRELGVEAYPVAALVAGGPGALSRPPGATVEGPEPCPGAPAAACWRLRHPSADGRLETELWVEAGEVGEEAVRRVEVRTVSDPLGFAAALADAGLDPGRRPAADRPEVAVRTTLAETGPPSPERAVQVVLGPPPEARRVETWSAPPAGGGDAGGPQVGFGETIDVALASFVVRVVDRRGDPVAGLGPDDFLVTAGDRRVPVRSVDFYAAGSGPPVDLPPRAAAAAPVAPSPPPPEPAFAELPPKLVVLFVQADFNSLRTRGHLKMLPFVERVLAELPPDDLVAVVSFDSHLEPWLDLTTDREAAHEAVWRAIHFGADPPSGRPLAEGEDERRRGPSLFERIDPAEAADAAYPEAGLEIVARALVPLPGEKVVVFLGWGLGYRTRAAVRMRRDYRPAVDALTAARASVFVLDVTEASYHDLEIGLRRVAADTGGTYEKTVDFPTQAVRRLTALLASHYVLTVDLGDLPPAARRGAEALDVQLVGHPGARLLIRPAGGG